MSDTIDLNDTPNDDQRGSTNAPNADGSFRGGPNGQYSSNSSVGSKSNRSRGFRYRGRMLTVKAMDQLPPVNENHFHHHGHGGSGGMIGGGGGGGGSGSDFFGRSRRNNLAYALCCPSPFDATSRRTLYFCICCFLIYLFIGTLTYTLWIPSWNVVDAMYFSVSTFTTVGYGDIVPMDDGQRAFTLIYVIAGTFLAGGIFFGYLFHFMYNTFEEITAEAKQMTSDYFISRMDHGMIDDNGTSNVGMIMNLHDEEEPFWADLCRMFGKTVPLLCALIVPPLIMGYYEDWNVLSSFYFTVATASTGAYE